MEKKSIRRRISSAYRQSDGYRLLDICNLACSGLSQLRSRCVRGRIIYTGYKGTLKPVVLELLV